MTDQRKPREFFICLDPDYDLQSWTHHRAYVEKQHYIDGEQIHVREVMPDDENPAMKKVDIYDFIELEQKLDRMTRALEKAKEVIKTFGVNLKFKELLKEIEAIERGEK